MKLRREFGCLVAFALTLSCSCQFKGKTPVGTGMDGAEVASVSIGSLNDARISPEKSQLNITVSATGAQLNFNLAEGKSISLRPGENIFSLVLKDSAGKVLAQTKEESAVCPPVKATLLAGKNQVAIKACGEDGGVLSSQTGEAHVDVPVQILSPTPGGGPQADTALPLIKLSDFVNFQFGKFAALEGTNAASLRLGDRVQLEGYCTSDNRHYIGFPEISLCEEKGEAPQMLCGAKSTIYMSPVKVAQGKQPKELFLSGETPKRYLVRVSGVVGLDPIDPKNKALTEADIDSVRK